MNPIIQVLWVACGGALGAICRLGIAEISKALHGGGLPVGGPGFPWGTMAANFIGCFLMGMLLGSGAADRWVVAKAGIEGLWKDAPTQAVDLTGVRWTE